MTLTASTLTAWVHSHATIHQGWFYYRINDDIATEDPEGRSVLYEIPFNGKLVCVLDPDLLDQVRAICRANKFHMRRINFPSDSPQVPDRIKRPEAITPHQIRILYEAMAGVQIECSPRGCIKHSNPPEPLRKVTVDRLLKLEYLEYDGFMLVPTDKAWEKFGFLFQPVPRPEESPPDPFLVIGDMTVQAIRSIFHK